MWRAIDPDVVWGLDPMLLALLVDEIRVLRWQFERVHFKGKPERPKPIPRPGVAPEPEVEKVAPDGGFDTIEEFQAWYAARQWQPSETSC